MDDQEEPIRDAVRRRDISGAATKALSLYGSELFGYALWLARTERHAEIGYEDAEERVREELGGFAWTVSLRAWGHALVREAVKTVEARQPILTTVFDGRTLEPVPPHRKFVFPVHADQAELLRLVWLRFSKDEQELLLLRWGRRLPWTEIALVLGGPGAATDAIDQECERLRARFREVKARAAIFREDLRRDPP